LKAKFSIVIHAFGLRARITVRHPKRTRFIAESRIKNDKVDSKALAGLLRLNALRHLPLPVWKILKFQVNTL
jgi:hypothetical protein